MRCFGYERQAQETRANARNTAAAVRRRIENGGERLWRFADFGGLPFTAVAQSVVPPDPPGNDPRLGKGLYYRPRQTAFGPSRPNVAEIRTLPVRRKKAFPSASPRQSPGLHHPKRRPGSSWPPTAQAFRDASSAGMPSSIRAGRSPGGHFRDRRGPPRFPPQQGTFKRTVSRGNRRKTARPPPRARAFRVCSRSPRSEPPRVRAMLGAIGQQLGHPRERLAPLRRSLNPLSRFDFGILAALTYAKEWQAKERMVHEAL